MNNEGTQLTREYGRKFLKQYGFERSTTKIGTNIRHKKDGGIKVVDEIEVWWIRDGISIHEDQWEKEMPFAYATYIKSDGSYKGGFQMRTDSQIKNLYFALTNRLLLPVK